MPKIYDNPKDTGRRSGETRVDRENRTMGSGPRGPSAQTENRATLVAVVVVLAIIIAIAFYRAAHGEEFEGMANQPSAPISYQQAA